MPGTILPDQVLAAHSGFETRTGFVTGFDFGRLACVFVGSCCRLRAYAPMNHRPNDAGNVPNKSIAIAPPRSSDKSPARERSGALAS
jgi:hypothetical protein